METRRNSATHGKVAGYRRSSQFFLAVRVTAACTGVPCATGAPLRRRRATIHRAMPVPVMHYVHKVRPPQSTSSVSGQASPCGLQPCGSSDFSQLRRAAFRRTCSVFTGLRHCDAHIHFRGQLHQHSVHSKRMHSRHSHLCVVLQEDELIELWPFAIRDLSRQ